MVSLLGLTRIALVGTACTVMMVFGYNNPGLLSEAVRLDRPSVAQATSDPVSAMVGLARPFTEAQRSEPLSAPAPAVTTSTAQEIPNPLRGQYEDLMQPLFPQGNPAQRRYPAWPASHDASLRVSWRQLQPTDPRTLPPDAPDDRKFDFSAIDDALTKLAGRNMRMTLRVVAYSSCCEAFYPNHTNIEVPDWLAAIPGATARYPGPPNSPEAWITQVVPSWNNPDYLNGFSQLLAALGRRYDHDERLSVFEFSGYGDFSENHIAYLRDSLGAPGPAPEDSVAKLGYYSQFRDQSISTDAIRQLVAANVHAFPHTQLVTTTLNPEIVRRLLADDVTKQLSAPVGIRSDCLGVYPVLPVWAKSPHSHYVQIQDPVVDAIKRRLASAPVITEWCQLFNGTDPQSYYEMGLHDVVAYHVGMTSSFNFLDRDSTSVMDPRLYAIWARANASAGYRYTVESRLASQLAQGKAATVSVAWTNYGSAAAFERWAPAYQLVDSSGTVLRTVPAAVKLSTLVPDIGPSGGEVVPASATESLRIDLNGLAPGRYTLRAVVSWQQHKPEASHVVNYPPMLLARGGRDDSGGYPIATLDLPQTAGSSPPAMHGGHAYGADHTF